MQRILETKLFPFVEQPAQYIGNEYNAVVKNWDEAKAKMVFCFPDSYEIAMSHLGTRILYNCVNLREEFLMERTFMPKEDALKIMREENIPLFSWENKKRVSDFDFFGVTLQYEMSYSNILTMMKLGGIPIYSKDRGEDMPIVVAGGSCAYSPEPLADFVDIFLLGEGEETLLELMDLWLENKKNGGSKMDYLKRVSQMGSMYVPALYEEHYNEETDVVELIPMGNAPKVMTKTIIPNMDLAEFPKKDMVPYVQIVHDRLVLEVMRGCNRGCRFCQAGVVYRPVREKSPEVLLAQADELIKNTGYDEIGMVSLSTADYSCVGDLIDGLMDNYKDKGVSVSLPSLRADAFSVDLAKKVQTVRKSGLTFAPEAGSQRLRDVINKGISENDIYTAATNAFREGWSTIKLYFMIGLPFETYEDLDGIYNICVKLNEIYREICCESEERRKPLSISVSAAVFVPKAHTPFQWYGQCSREELREKVDYLHTKFKTLKYARLSCHDDALSFLEAAFARGDRRLCKVLARAVELGCHNDGWRECFSYELWQQAFADCGYTISQFANRTFEKGQVLPWSHISVGANEKWLWREWEKAKEAVVTPDCRKSKCSGCGVCPNLHCDNVYIKNNAYMKNEEVK